LKVYKSLSYKDVRLTV